MVAFKTSFSLIAPEHDRLDKLLATLLPFSRSRLQSSIDADLVQRNGAVLHNASFKKFSPRDRIDVTVEPVRTPDARPQDIPLTVVGETDHFLVVDKQPGLVVHPAPGHPDGTLVNAVMHHLASRGIERERMPGGDEFRPGIVHRIDKDTSGLLVVVKTTEAFDHFSRLFHNHAIGREYVAFVWGSPDETAGAIKTGHSRDSRDRRRYTVSRSGGKRAVTHYRVVRRYRHVSKIALRLETGRTHQIRVHMKHLGHPVVNDELYGGVIKSGSGDLNRVTTASGRQLLHAASLSFRFREQMYSFTSPLPDDMKAVEDILMTITRNRRRQ